MEHFLELKLPFSIDDDGLGVFLKLVSAIFIFSPNSPSKTMKNAFYFIEKALFVPEIFKFL